MLLFKNDLITLIQEDFLKIDFLERNSIDLIVTSPPYNVGIDYNSHQDSQSYNEYLLFIEEALRKCFDLLKNDGRLCLNVPLDKNKGGQQSVGADVTTIAKKVGLKYHSTVIWNEGNISRRTAWGSWLNASAPYVIAPVELILILYKNHWGKLTKGKSDITKQEFMDWTNGIWTFTGESKKRIGHPAPFPLELPKRCIKLFSYIGDTVLDPFVGSGTTLISAALLKRKVIGIEIDSSYCKLAMKRILNFKELNQTTLIFENEQEKENHS